MKALFARLTPRSLAGQIIFVVAIALLVAQAVNFTLIMRERNRQHVIGSAAPAVARIVDAIERRDEDSHRPERQRVRFTAAPPPADGARRPDIEQRAADILTELGHPPMTVRAYAEPIAHSGEHLWRARNRIDRGPPRDISRLTLAVELTPGRWAATETRIMADRPPLGGWLIVQTIIFYIIVLIPLALVGRRLARPLQALTGAARQFASTGTADPVPETGPGDVRDLATAFNAMRTRIMAMLDEKDRMLGAIGHDLRTPLASLRVRAESVEDESERTRMSETIEEMNRMLDDILSLARAGRSIEPLQKVDLAALADAVVEDFIELGKPVTIADTERTIASIRSNGMRRAVRNLIENAIEYGGSAHVSVTRSDHQIRVSVADNGPGIAQDRMAEMMEPFTRLDPSRNRETGGAGLGLALVRAIMTEHGGALELANRPEGGLEASLVLPA